MTRFVAVCGPTATGKSALALKLCRIFGGELAGADSMQVYAGLSVGTAAVTPRQAAGVPLHLTGFLPPERAYSAADWLCGARRVLREISGRGALPVFCGGTGLYVKSLAEGAVFTPHRANAELRAALEREWEEEGGAAMLQKLALKDPAQAARLHPNDKKRVVRALELMHQTGRTAEQRAPAAKTADEISRRALCIGLTYADRARLYAAIEQRVDEMLLHGLLDEARRVWQSRAEYATAAQAIGYKEFFDYFEGRQTREACVGRLKQATRNYAKRQLTWFRAMPYVRWLNADDPNLAQKAEELTADFLRGGFVSSPERGGDP